MWYDNKQNQPLVYSITLSKPFIAQIAPFGHQVGNHSDTFHHSYL